MMDSLPELMERYRQLRLQLVFVADGDRQTDLRRLVQQIVASDRIAVCDFNAGRHRLAYGGADFVLMPLAFDPCVLPCKIGQRYGALPIAYDTGAIHDCVEHLNLAENTGNGFLFTYFDVNGFLWAMDQAMDFYRQSAAVRSIHVQRIMTDSLKKLNREGAILRLIEHYRRVLDRFPEKKASPDSSSCLYPTVARAGAIRSQGAMGAVVILYCNFLATPDLDSSGFPVRV